VDGRIVQSVRDGKGALIKSQADVGGWPQLKSKPAPADTDGDGMPDQWEQSHGLNPNDASDGAKAGEGGYTNIEVYLDSLVLSPAAAK
jgi:pectate lyase